MSNNIERLNYYEREYLRSFDFIAEQNYHLEMRRRLNLALHLWGIVDGLEVLKGVLTPGALEQFYVSPGMAIDAFGREIMLFAPYALSEDDLVANHINGSGNYPLWIVYHRELATPPAPGYRVCDIKDQYTRWHESYRIVLPNDPNFPGPDPGKIPEPVAYLSDDPVKAPSPVRLGTVTVTNVVGKLTITNAWSEERIYVGVRAQRIIVPHVAPRIPPVDPILSKTAPLDTPLSLGVQADVFAEQNLIVGGNFEIDKTKIIPTPVPVAPATFPNPTGNLKVTGDLFLQGNLYAKVQGTVNDEWLGLSEYLQKFIPDVLTGIKPLEFPATSPAGQFQGVFTFTVSSTKLKEIGKANGIVSLGGIKLNTRTEVDSIFSGTTNLSCRIIDVTATPHSPLDNGCDVRVTWLVEPNINDLLTFRGAIIEAYVSYVVVCFPP